MEQRRSIASVLFTDIVESTEKAAALGDRRWREVLRQHDLFVREQLRRFQGEEIATAGDGFLAVFDNPARAITCAAAIRDSVREIGLEVRCGVHMGEVERSNGAVGGIGVHIGARIAAHAGAGEVLVSATVKDAEAGSEFEFEDRGRHELKGVPGQWWLYALTSVPDHALEDLPEARFEAGPSLWQQARRAGLVPVLTIYLAASAVLLAITQALVTWIGLPQRLLPGAAVLLSVGLVVVTATALVNSQPRTMRKAAGGKLLRGRETDAQSLSRALIQGELLHLTWGQAIAGGVFPFTLLVLLAGLVAWGWVRPSTVSQAEPVRVTAMLPPGVSASRGPGVASSVALSPDGRTLVIAGTDANGQRLYRRTLDQLEATPIAGAEGGCCPFFSPDGRWVGFFADRRLKRVPVVGGAAVDIAVVPGFPSGASWGPDDRIVFAYGARSALQVANTSGGETEELTALDAKAGELSHTDPEILPDGSALLFVSNGWIHALDLASGRRTALVEGAAPRYAASGHVILSRGTTLLAAPFDPTRLELTGPVVPLVEGVAGEEATGTRHVAVSRSGTLAYLPAAGAYTLVLVEADGTERHLAEESPLLQNPQFSPDGRQVVVATSRRAGERPDLWIYELETGAPPSRLTFDGGRAPVWTPDGSAVTYSRPVPGERWGIYSRFSDGRGDAERIVHLTEFHWLVGWTPDGRTLLYGIMEGVAADGVSRSSIVAFAGGETRRVVGPGEIWGGRLSPNGRWLAYYSRESGYFEVYVTPFPDTGTQWLIAEGTDPSWSPDGVEVYYRSGSRLMAARIDTTAGIRVLSRRVVIEPFSPPLYDDYDIHPEGRTLVLVRPADNAQGREVTLVLNWLTEMRRKGKEPSPG